MNFSEDLQRVLWHEIGHFCVDLLEVESNPSFSIDELWVSYHEKAISNHKWAGGVKMVPSVKWNILVEDLDKTAFSMLGFISGCVFETVFRNEFLQNKVLFEDCFSHKSNCAGNGDFRSFFLTGSEFRKKYGRKPDFIKFSETELSEIYYHKIIANQAFLEQLNELIINKRDAILDFYNKSDNKIEFFYHFSNKDLDILKDFIYEIMYKTSFKETILELKESIRTKMETEPQV
jgi:hypothetical protein